MFLAWKEFRRGKTNKLDIQQFEFNLEDNLFHLHWQLKNRTYQHLHYTSFYVQDPKLRHIHKADVRDRVLHHAVFRILYPIFDKGFVFDSYSCRINKGTHRAVNRLELFVHKESKNNKKKVFVLKCDIKKFFASIDQNILLELIKNKVKDVDTVWLIEKIIRSFQTQQNKGLPLGNVTSQLLANIYLNELDQFIKHRLKVKYYIRYCDDFVILKDNKEYLYNLILLIGNFLKSGLRLSLHPNKVTIRKYDQGIDFLGYVVLPYYRVLRTKTKRRMFIKLERKYQQLRNNQISRQIYKQCLQSYLGILKHCKGYKIKKRVIERYFIK